jgi:hypothetical protein
MVLAYDYTMHAIEKASSHLIGLGEIRKILSSKVGRSEVRLERCPNQVRYKKMDITVVVDLVRRKVITCWRDSYQPSFSYAGW